MNKKFLDYFYILLMFILLVMGLFYFKKAYGDEYLNHFYYEEDFNYYNADQAIEDIPIRQFIALAYEDCKTYEDKCKFHKENAERCFRDAKNKCWWLPNIDDREKAKYCITTFGASFAAGDVKSKIVTLIVTALIQYGIDCCDEWNDIQTKLKWSQYHYEMLEFYEDVIKNQNQTGQRNQVTQKQVARRNATLPISNIKKKNS